MKIEGDKGNKKSFFQLNPYNKKKEHFPFAKSQPSQDFSMQFLRQKEDIIKSIFFDKSKRRTRLSVPHSQIARDFKSFVQLSSTKRQEKNINSKQADLDQKSIIHDTFTNYLTKNHKKVGIGINIVIIKRRQKNQKHGLGQLTSKMAVVKPLAIKQMTSNNSIKQKRKKWKNINLLNRFACKNEYILSEQERGNKELQRGYSVCNSRSNSSKKINLIPGLSYKEKLNTDNLRPWQQYEQNIFSGLKRPGSINPNENYYDIAY